MSRSEATANGSRFISADGQTEVELFRFKPGERSPFELFERAKRGNPNRKIVYARMGPSWFVVSGMEGTRRFYTRVRGERGSIVGFVVVYEENTASIVEPAIVVMSNIFADASRAALLLRPLQQIPGEPPQNAGKEQPPHEQMGSQPSPKQSGAIAVAFAIDRDGHLLTSARVALCRRVSLRGADAAIVAVDRKNDLALLKTNSGSELEAVFFDDRPITANSTVTVASPSDIATYVTSGRVTGLKGDDGDSTRFQASLPVRSSDGGSPVFNEQGAVVGVVVPMAPDAARRAIDEDRYSRSIIRHEVARLFLVATGLTPLNEVANNTIDAAERARKAALNVSCIDGRPDTSLPTSALQR